MNCTNNGRPFPTKRNLMTHFTNIIPFRLGGVRVGLDEEETCASRGYYDTASTTSSFASLPGGQRSVYFVVASRHLEFFGDEEELLSILTGVHGRLCLVMSNTMPTSILIPGSVIV